MSKQSDSPNVHRFGEPTSPKPLRAPQLLHKLWDLELGNVKATPYVRLRVASPLLPPPLEDVNCYPHFPGPPSRAYTLSGALTFKTPHQLQSTTILTITTHTIQRSYVYRFPLLPPSSVHVLGTSLDLLGILLPELVTLADYCQEVLCIDNHYWKHEETKKREAGKPFIARNPKKGSSDFPKSGSTNQQSNSQPSGSTAPFTPKPKSFTGGKPNNFCKPQGISNSGQPAGQRPTFTHLGANGKALPSKREHRMKNNLCLFCGGKHQIADCNKRKARELKGRAVEVEETPDTTSIVVEEESEN
ncbi:hypothetical protein F5876DRAFT_78588 [Lentinula aff. lateritia]|uniref:Uncharacterized protein n=1 Tax=Lentinula aff. lateritia TaxID=2804960 RepID=A0ACC1TV20_9AGAR|nr:hypothetical protein F5876DRAFT_78588 [Lentinula aff. lateritia]